MDKAKTIIAGGITIVSGLECLRCGLIRPYLMGICPCKPKKEKK